MNIALTFTPIEQEAIVLSAVVGMVDEMVNHAIFCPLGDKTTDTNLLPQTSETLSQFAILLRDFLSPMTAKDKDPLPFDLPRPPKNSDRVTDFTTLFYLTWVCGRPLIGTNVAALAEQVRDFADWLETDILVPEVWFSNIGKKVDLRIRRLDFIRMGGDINKHNFIRLGGQAKKLRAILHANDVEISQSEAYAALPDCRHWFHTHLFAYHASPIAEFLNNIRYAIRHYVRPTAEASYRVIRKIDDYADAYTFDRPDDLKDEFAWGQYHWLLDGSRRQASFPPFTVNRSCKSLF